MSAYHDLAGIVTFRPLERPLQAAWKPTPFIARWSSTVELLAKELRAHGAQRTILEVDFRESDLRQDGLPRADRRARTPGIVLSFDATAVPRRPHLCYEVAAFDDWKDNIRAIALGLQALRAVDRYGVTRLGEQYAGWRQLTAGEATGDPDRGRRLVAEHGGDVRRALAATHPDRGGDAADFRDVNAYRESRR